MPTADSRTVPATSSARATRDALVAGDRLGERYRVLGLVGEGGMGAVYRVFDEVLGEEVALKVVHDSAVEFERLRDEVRLAQHVTHRNVCRTYDLETVGGRHFVKMEYVAGETLAVRLARRGQLPLAHVIALARAISDGLAAAHAEGIVHRDLKPANVLLAADRVVITDFGLAQREGASDLAGTPGYMSPEQLAGEAVDARSDLYALGCVVFESLAGTPPFAGTVHEVMHLHATTPAPDVRERRHDTPRWLARAVAALLAKDPARRAQGIRALRAGPRARRWGLACGALVLALATVTWGAMPSRASWEPRVVDLAPYEENADGPAWSPDGNAVVYSSDRGHRDVWSVYVAPRAGAEPRQISAAGRFCIGARWTRDGRAVVMSCFAGRDREIVRQPLDGSRERSLGPGWIVDDCGDALAVVMMRPTGDAVVLRDRDGHDQELVTVPGRTIWSVRCDPRGEQILYLSAPTGRPNVSSELAVVDRFGTARAIPGVHDTHDAAFTADGRAVVFSRQKDSRTSLFEVALDGGEVHEVTPHEQYAAAPDVAPDGRSLIFDRDRTSLPLFELTPGGAVQKTFRFEALFHAVAAPRGDVIVASRQDGDDVSVVVIGLSDASERTLTRGEALFVTRDDRVVFRAPDAPDQLRAIPLAGGSATTLATFPAPIVDAADGPDGVHVELAGDRADLAWRVAPDGRIAPEGVAGLVMPAPDGGWRVVRAATGASVALGFVAPGQPLTHVAFERASAWGEPAWVDDHELAYCDLHACHRLDVATGVELETTAIEPPGKRPITVAADGRHWFSTSHLGHVTRHVITNFGDRPWAR